MLDEKIDFYLSILNPVDTEMPQSVKVSCKSCQGERFFVDFGYNICENCGITQGHALGFFDQREYERFHFRQKSIYQRKYHCEKRLGL